MGKTSKKKMTAVALATAAVLVLAGTMAYLADASGTIRNIFDDEHIRVQINESGITDSTTGANTDNGDKDYTVLPGTSEGKDPTITVDTDTDAYVFAVVKDTINSHTKQGASQATKFVDYHIADGWTLLDEGGESSEFGPKTIKKYVDILNEKTTGDLAVNPKDPNTRIYYRIVHGSELANGDHDTDDLTDHRFTFNVLTNDQISYPSSLTNEDMNLLNGISDEEQKALIFQTWAIQMEPFCPADEVATADPATDDQKQYAKDAWNETTVVPTSVTVTQAESKTEVKVGSTLQLTATVLPKNAVDKTVTWTSSDDNTATVDSNGVVTGVAAGTVTITATATAGDSVKGTYEVTVKGPTVSYAVELYKVDSTGVDFGPATSNVTTTSKSHTPSEGKRCIHDDSWATIIANIHEDPTVYSDCVSNGCTHAIDLTIPSDTTDTIWADNAATLTTTGDGVGVLYDELKSSARVWDADYEGTGANAGDYAYADIQSTLTDIYNSFPADLRGAISTKNISYSYNFEGETKNMDANIYLLNQNEHKEGSGAFSRGDGTGTDEWWWLRDSLIHPEFVPMGYHWLAHCVRYNGIIHPLNRVNVGNRGVAPGFSIAKAN